MDLQFTNLLYTLLLTIITTGTPILIGFLVMFIKSHISAKQLQTAKSLATNGVIFAQQVSKDLNLNNEQKLNSALASAQELAKKYGINLTSSQWKLLLEPAYNEVKKGLNELGNTSTTTTLPTDSTPNIPALPPVSNVVTSITVNDLSVPANMLDPLYNAISQRTNKDIISAVSGVIETVTKSIADVESIQPTPAQTPEVTPQVQ